MSDGLWACKQCGSVRVGPEETPPDAHETEPCPACGFYEDRVGYGTYRSVSL